MSESSHFPKCEYGSLRAISHRSALSTALWLLVSAQPPHAVSPHAHLPGGRLVIGDNFVLNTF